MESDLRRIDRMKDEEIDYSDIPELDAEFFATARVVVPPGKKQVTVGGQGRSRQGGAT